MSLLNRPLVLVFALILLLLAIAVIQSRDQARPEVMPATSIGPTSTFGLVELPHSTDSEPMISPAEVELPVPRAPVGNSTDHDRALRYLEKALRRDTAHTTITVAADGTMTADLNGGYRSATLARVISDGSIETGCFDDFKESKSFLLRAPKDYNQGGRASLPTVQEPTPIYAER